VCSRRLFIGAVDGDEFRFAVLGIDAGEAANRPGASCEYEIVGSFKRRDMERRSP
jgi:hypothetical protein